MVRVLNHWLDFDGQLKRRKTRPDTAAIVVMPEENDNPASNSRKASDGATIAGDGVFIYQ